MTNSHCWYATLVTVTNGDENGGAGLDMVSENMIAWCETHYLSVAGGVSASVAAINFSTRFLQSVTYQ